ncbi:hypothetical protein ACFODR_09670 [Pseudidiomarina halophila]
MRAAPTVERKAQEYTDEAGRSPFQDWLISLKDNRVKVNVWL